MYYKWNERGYIIPHSHVVSTCSSFCSSLVCYDSLGNVIVFVVTGVRWCRDAFLLLLMLILFILTTFLRVFNGFIVSRSNRTFNAGQVKKEKIKKNTKQKIQKNVSLHCLFITCCIYRCRLYTSAYSRQCDRYFLSVRCSIWPPMSGRHCCWHRFCNR